MRRYVLGMVALALLLPAPAVQAAKKFQRFTLVKDNTQFDQVIERLRADREIKIPDMLEVARLFLGYELPKKKGRAGALQEIIERQAVEARQEAKGSLLDRLKPW